MVGAWQNRDAAIARSLYIDRAAAIPRRQDCEVRKSSIKAVDEWPENAGGGIRAANACRLSVAAEHD
jgi:hypothetical protein